MNKKLIQKSFSLEILKPKVKRQKVVVKQKIKDTFAKELITPVEEIIKRNLIDFFDLERVDKKFADILRGKG